MGQLAKKDPLGIIQPPVRRRQSGPQERLPENVRLNPITKWRERSREEETGLSWENELRTQQNYLRGRLPDLTDSEREYIEYDQREYEWLTVAKAQELKVWWAIGYTAEECAQAYKIYGYSVDTTKKYWALFNRAASPTE